MLIIRALIWTASSTSIIHAKYRENGKKNDQSAPQQWAATLTADLKYKIDKDILRRLMEQRSIRAVTVPAGSVMFFHGKPVSRVHKQSLAVGPYQHLFVLLQQRGECAARKREPATRIHRRPRFPPLESIETTPCWSGRRGDEQAYAGACRGFRQPGWNCSACCSRKEASKEAAADRTATKCRSVSAFLRQERIWKMAQCEGRPSFYNFEVKFEGALEVSVLESSIGEVIRRQEVLRTTFDLREGQLVQIVGPEQRFNLPLVDLSGFDETERDAEVRKLCLEQCNDPFDLTFGPVLRFTLVRLDAEIASFGCWRYRTSFCDHTSIQLFANEVASVYNTFSQGRPSPLAELTFQYADFACWEREWF